MLATFEAIDRQLGHGALLRRYADTTDDGLAPGEGAFGICGFWAVEYLARAGRVDEAERRFAELLGCANDVGLFAEEVDPSDGSALGNTPQPFTHIGLINAALALSASS